MSDGLLVDAQHGVLVDVVAHFVADHEIAAVRQDFVFLRGSQLDRPVAHLVYRHRLLQFAALREHTVFMHARSKRDQRLHSSFLNSAILHCIRQIIWLVFMSKCQRSELNCNYTRRGFLLKTCSLLALANIALENLYLRGSFVRDFGKSDDFLDGFAGDAEGLVEDLDDSIGKGGGRLFE